MHLKKAVMTATALAALPAAYAQEALGALGVAGGLFESVFAGIFGNIGQPVWMKVLLTVIAFTLLYTVFSLKKDLFNNGARTILSIAIAVAMIAPLSDAFVMALFGSLGFVGLLFYIAPVIGLMFLTRKLTHEKDKPVEERHYYVIALILWLITWIGYINGVGFGADIGYVGWGMAVLNLVALGYIFYYGYKSINPSAKEEKEDSEEPSEPKKNWIVDKVKQKYQDFSVRHLAAAKETVHHVARSLNRIVGEIENADWNHMIQNRSRLRTYLHQLADELTLLADKTTIENLKEHVPPNILKDLASDTNAVAQMARRAAEMRYAQDVDAADRKRLLDEIKKWFGGQGNALRVYKRWKTELRA